MTDKKLYTYEFSVLEQVFYEISVEAENYEEAEDIAHDKIGNNQYVVDAKTKVFECTHNEEEFLKGE
tara:strand:+ start:450 stop:650 length:201 start_codon:yes stop_codon:yes gene_type:complete